MLSLNQRECQLGNKYRGGKRRDEEVRTLVVNLDSIPLDREEVNQLLGDPHAYESLYDTSSVPHKPFLSTIKAIELKDSWDGGNVALYYHLGESKVELKKAKLSRIRLEPTPTGSTHMSCTVEGEPDLDRKFSDLIGKVGDKIECEIRANSPAEQKELALNQHGEGEQPEQRRRGGKSWAKRGAGTKRRRGAGARATAH